MNRLLQGTIVIPSAYCLEVALGHLDLLFQNGTKTFSPEANSVRVIRRSIPGSALASQRTASTGRKFSLLIKNKSSHFVQNA